MTDAENPDTTAQAESIIKHGPGSSPANQHVTDEQNPYALVQGEILQAEIVQEGPSAVTVPIPSDPPGIRRFPYLLGYMSVYVGIYALLSIALGSRSLTMAITTALVLAGLALAARMFLLAVRIKNIGYHWAWSLFVLSGFPGVIMELVCLVLPANFAYTKKLDEAGKIAGSFLIVLILIVVFFLVFDPFSPPSRRNFTVM